MLKRRKKPVYLFAFEFDGKSSPSSPVGVHSLPVMPDRLPFTTIYSGEIPSHVFEVIGSFYNFGGDVFQEMSSKPINEVLAEIAPQLGTGELICQSDSGEERWKITGLFPHSINFGELCYSTSDEVEVEITWRYANMVYTKP
jgi:hypothetical protein